MSTNFTPEEIAQILEEFFKVVGTRQYIGARYVPIFGRKDESSIEWDNTAPYDPLTIVLYQGNSYTSRQYVPTGVDIYDMEFWANTGNYNAQVEQYRQEVVSVSQRIDTISDIIPESDFSANSTVKEYIDDRTQDIKERTLVTLESFYAKELGAYVRKVTIPRSYRRGLIMRDRRERYIGKPYDYIRTLNTNTVLVNGQLPSVTVIDGEIVAGNPSSPQHWYYFGWDENGDFMYIEDFYQSVTGATLLSDNFYYAIGIWGPIVVQRQRFDLYETIPADVRNPTDRDYILKQPQNSNVFAWDSENIYIYQTDGRSPNSAGVLVDTLASYVINDGVESAVLMDGGGSNQLWTTRPAINHTMYNYYAGSNVVNGFDYNYQGDNSRDVYSMITFSEV